MSRAFDYVLMVALGAAVTVATTAATRQGGQAKPAQANDWQLPPDAADKQNPLSVDDKVLAQGKSVFKDKCQRCHGPGGLGDGPDADPDARADMDLTDPKRGDRNPDGVVFYKVWNGRRKPKMPTFKEELTEQQVWAVVAYTQTLRKKR
jgi:mono/diheme cytochrome c family protein